MRGISPRGSWALALGLLLAIFAAGAGQAKVYRWVDSDGVPHFTDRAEEVPPIYRDQIHDVSDELDTERRFTMLGGSEPTGEPSAEAEVAPTLDPEAWADLEQLLEQGDVAGVMSGLGAGMIGFAVLSVLLVIAIGTAFGALVLILACRICNEDSPRFRKAAGVVVLQVLAGIAASIVLALALGISDAGAGGGAAQFGLSTVVNAGVLRGLLIESFGKALLVSLVVTVVGFLIGVALFFAALCAGGAAALL